MIGFLNINEFCNFKCLYCDLRERTNTNQLNLEILPDIISFCKKNGIETLELPQREPLFDEVLFRNIVDILFENKINITGLTTNLYNLSNKTINTLFKYNIYVLVSYDGLWQDTFRPHKNGTKTAQQVTKNITKLKKNNIKFGIATTVTNQCSDLYENVKFMHNITPNLALNFDVLSEFAIKEETLSILEEELKKVYTEFPRIFPFSKIQQRIRNKSQYSNFVCGAGRGSVTINYDGKLYPCYQVDTWKKIGISLGDIWNGINYTEKEKFKYYDSCQKDVCKKCNTAICGICYTTSFLKMKNMLMPIPIECKIKKLLTEIIPKNIFKKKNRIMELLNNV